MLLFHFSCMYRRFYTKDGHMDQLLAVHIHSHRIHCLYNQFYSSMLGENLDIDSMLHLDYKWYHPYIDVMVWDEMTVSMFFHLLQNQMDSFHNCGQKKIINLILNDRNNEIRNDNELKSHRNEPLVFIHSTLGEVLQPPLFSSHSFMSIQ